MRIFRDILRKNHAAILLWVMINGFNAAVFVLYGVMREPLLYAMWISLCLLAVLLTSDYLREKKHHEERLRTAETVVNDRKSLPEAHSLAEEDYQAILAALGGELERVTADFSERQVDQMDYYTAWVHQIKTPIAVMKLRLSGDTPEDRQLLAELLRVEQYVDMVLQYIRLGSTSNDLVIREYRLDELIREAVRKFAPLFVEKRLRLDFTPTERGIVTDRKWFVCVLEQLISNAVKYTPSGSVAIGMENGVLCISDTGIGIAPEDLPRIFEKGYTGLNGRMGQKSSGLGLYLAKKAADLLAIPLRVESREGEGSRFLLDLKTAP